MANCKCAPAVVAYPSYDTTEWTVSFANTSTSTSKRLSEVLAANTVLNPDGKAGCVLHHFNGRRGTALTTMPFVPAR